MRTSNRRKFIATATTGSFTGSNAIGYGNGGGGGVSYHISGSTPGGSGSNGILIITEYLG